MNEWMKSTCFVFKLRRKKQVLALLLIEDLGFLPLVREIQRFSTRVVEADSIDYPRPIWLADNIM
jgi:hypothetical protein